MQERAKQRLSWSGIIILVLLLAGIFASFGPPALMEKTSTAVFCRSCHIMKPEYTTWSRSSHQKIECVDCHLPNNDPVSHYVEKSIVGIRDLVEFYGGLMPKSIEATARSRKVIKANCIRCHTVTVSRINTERTCWECHRNVLHIKRFAEEYFRSSH